MTHKRNVVWSCLLVSWALVTAIVFAQDDDFTISEPKQRTKLVEQARALFREKKWNDLDDLASDFRATKARFPSGRWKLEWFYDALCEPPDPRTAPREWDGHLAALEEWRRTKPNSPTPMILLGKFYIGYGWEARGSGFANTVAEEGWRLLAERVVKARGYFDAAEKLPTKDPECYRGLLAVGQAQGWKAPEYDAVFSRAVELEPDYLNFYFAKAAYLLPRWFGEPGDLERFAEEAVKDCPEEGAAMYARVAWSVVRYAEQDSFFQTFQFSWPRMREGFQAMCKQYPKSLWNVNAFCYFACLQHDREIAQPLFEQIGEKWAEGVWQNEGRYLHWKNWAQGKAEYPSAPSAPPAPVESKSTWSDRLRQLFSW